MTPTSPLKTLQTKIGGMDCGNCAKTVEAGLQKLPGVTDINVVFTTESLRLNYDPQQVSEKAIFDRIKTLGYTIEKTVAAIPPSEDSCCSHE
jgi:Cation transport ATPase